MTGQVIAFNIPVENMEKMTDFYGQVFGWTIRKGSGSGDYHRAETVPAKEGTPLSPGAINGGLFLAGTHGISEPFFEVLVDSIDETIRQVVALGGRSVVKKKVMGDSFFAIVQDPEGNYLGLWEDLEA
jgi:predicted enzyme related to lactoylglutathione lyase